MKDHGPISWKKQITMSLGPSVGVNQMWTKRNDYAPKNECVDFFNTYPKMVVLTFLSLTILLSSSSLHISKFPYIMTRIISHHILWQYSFFMGPFLFQPKHLFCLSQCKTRWTMSMDNVSLKICLLRTLNSLVTLTFFSLVWTEMVMGQVQQPITFSTRPWDDFMVHDVNKP